MKYQSVTRRSLLACTALASVALLPGQALAQDAEENRGLEEIIVTAQKREQSVQDVPIAVTAVTAETLKANRIFTVNDLGSIAPGVTVRPSAGGIQVPSFTIRGQNSFGVVAGSDKQVSIYLDGVYISAARSLICPTLPALKFCAGPRARCSAATPLPARSASPPAIPLAKPERSWKAPTAIMMPIASARASIFPPWAR